MKEIFPDEITVFRGQSKGVGSLRQVITSIRR